MKPYTAMDEAKLYEIASDPSRSLTDRVEAYVERDTRLMLARGQQKAEPGSKFDAGKARLDLIAPELLLGTAEILAFGAQKYGARNWEAGMSWSRPFGALMRHMWAWWRGEQLDDETGKSHLWHAACCLMFLMAFEARKAGTDDRPGAL